MALRSFAIVCDYMETGLFAIVYDRLRSYVNQPLNSSIRKFSETTELLLTAKFPLSVNSTEKQQSHKFRQRIKQTVGCFDMFGNIRFRKKLPLSDRESSGRWLFNSRET